MPTEYLHKVFRNYFSTIAFSHSNDIEEMLQNATKKLFVDVFAHVPELNTWILCWSATAANTANRVFIPDSHSAFRSAQQSQSGRICSFPPSAFSRDSTHEHDIALHAINNPEDAIVLVPISDHNGKVFGAIRLIGTESDLGRLKFTKDSPGFSWNGDKDDSITVPDPDLIPHVLGRWAGSFYGHRGTNKVLALLLTCFSSFFHKSHNMYYKRDFDNDMVEFLNSTSPGTAKILEGLKASIHDHRYMFAIVTERGATEIVDDFPDDLPSDLRLNYTQWSPSDIFYRLKEALGVSKLSYIGIPLKVDDAVVGVFTLLTPFAEQRFSEGARFIRSTLSEMGRTVDKKAMTRSAQIIRTLKPDAPLLKSFGKAVPSLSKGLVESLVKELVPYGKLSVGVIEARLGANTETTEGLPKNISDYLQNSIPDLVLSGSTTLYIAPERKENAPICGVVAMPITSTLPFLVYIYGPIGLLTGRTLRTALEQLQATLNLSLAAAEGSASSNLELSNWRGHLALWAKIHELKNRTAGFSKPLRDLVSVSSNGDWEDLKGEVLSFKDNFTDAIEDFELECNDILRGTAFRSVKEETLLEIIRRTLSILIQFPDLRGKVQFTATSRLNIPMRTYTAELELVIRDLIRNILQHFERVSKAGNIIFETKDLPRNRIQIKLAGTIPAGSEAKKVNAILDDAESRNSLRRHIKPTVEKLLQGEIRAEQHPEYGSVRIVLTLPKDVFVH